jgi:hypothetical protein
MPDLREGQDFLDHQIETAVESGGCEGQWEANTCGLVVRQAVWVWGQGVLKDRKGWV